MRYLLSEIAQIVGGTLVGCDREVHDICTDSRSSAANEGSLFVAMNGLHHNSHRYISQMQRRGVRAYLIEDSTIELSRESSYVICDNAIAALQRLAGYHRRQFKGTVVAITGSNGKTTVKEWVAQSAPSHIKIFRSPRSYNSQLGVALSLLMLEGDEQLAIIEAGISTTGEMEPLVEMISPNIAVVTYIGEAHQEGFKSIEQKIEEKLIIGRGADILIYHSECSAIMPYMLFNGSKDGATRYIDAAEFTSAQFTEQSSRTNSQIVSAILHSLGYSAPNFGAITPIAMRLERIEGLSGSILINDSYNNDINSLIIALDTLQRVAKGGETTIILSDIAQSGITKEVLYSRVAEAIERAKVKRLIGVGGDITAAKELFKLPSKFFTTTQELLDNISSEDYANRAILIKGSRSFRMEQISHALAQQSHTTTLEVNLDAMVRNLNHYRSHLNSGVKLTAMVKASSYGAGEIEIAQTLQEQGVDYLAVAFADEGAHIRERGITMPIIVLNADDGSFAQMVDYRLEPEIYSICSLENFARAVAARTERRYPIHIKLDTGMHRLGFMEHEVNELVAKLAELKEMVYVASIFSHLACADMEGEDAKYATHQQIEIFTRASSQIEAGIGYKTIRHIANSAAILSYPEAQFEMCRLGIGLYGFGAEGLEPISTLKSRIVLVKEVKKEEAIGYGAMGRLSRDSMIATIPIGYADGVDRRLGCGAWSVMIRGKCAPIVGRVCMDSCMVDVTDIEEVKAGDDVIIFSDIKGNRAQDMADILDTISYEVLTSVSKRVKRVYIRE